MSSKHSRNRDRSQCNYKHGKLKWYLFTALITVTLGLLFMQLYSFDTYNSHPINARSPFNHTVSNQSSLTNGSGKNISNTLNVTAFKTGNRTASSTNSTISKMSTTEANTTTNANAASPFPPKLANTTNYFPPNNKAEIVKGAALLRDKAYQPNPVRVKAGGTVTWTNLDTVVHTITYGKGITDPAMGTKFDSGMLGGSFSQRFFKPGAYPYFCQIHPTMVGAVIVK
jgi:plastocyanin